jgi:hypothetical protein
MAKLPIFPEGERPLARGLLFLLIPAAVLAGLYGRFKGIGTWPLGVDEFYISRSIDRVLSTGIPSFACGGYYTRGVLYQYLVAPLRIGGLSSEFAGRLVAGLCSLLVLPSAYLLGRRVRGPLAGWLTVIILCLSVWEIEMARFGRMYAPFQAVFACYLLFYVRYTVDANAAALRWMMLLSVIGVLTWEGGTLLGVANLFAAIPMRNKGRLEREDWPRLAVLVLLLALLYAASRDLRGAAGSNDAGSVAANGAAADRWLFLHSAWLALRPHPGWAFAFLAPLCAAAAALRFIGSHRNRWLTFVGLSLILLAALGHAFTVVLGLLALMLLTGALDVAELTAPRARPWVLALLGLFLYWLAYVQFAGDQSLEFLFGFPDVFEHVARPLGRALPLETVGLALCAIFWFVRSVAVPMRASGAIRPLLALLILMVLAVAAIPTERIETRYMFFLYPLLIVLAVAAVLEFVDRAPLRPPALSGLLLVAAPLLCFAVTEDFQPRHLAHIDSAASNFRLGMRPARADHYYPRNDMRGVAGWLAAHVQTGDVVVSGIPNLDQYDPGFDYFYLDEQDNRYDAYVCADGRTERWTNHPVIFNLKTLEPAAVSGHRLYATVYPDVGERLQQEARALGWTVTQVYLAQDGKTAVLSIRGGGRDSLTE